MFQIQMFLRREYLVVQQAALSEARSSEWMPAALRTMSTQARPQSLHTETQMSLVHIRLSLPIHATAGI